jgi:acylphosphatase
MLRTDPLFGAGRFQRNAPEMKRKAAPSKGRSSQRIVRVRITGGVQGVCYRAWTGSNARALGINGWVRNREDGSVEAVFAGAASAIEDMLARCAIGPPAAIVEGVAVIEERDRVPAGFSILPTE